MNLLLDTHIFIWWDSEPEKLSEKVFQLCNDPQNTLILSTASLWEIQIKSQLGKIELGKPLNEIVEEQIAANNLLTLDIKFKHVYELENLPDIHNDPFDRIIIAQAKSEEFKLLSHDSKMADYPVEIIC